ncbi:hypothetical protein B0H19DRAFT_1080614 [Mycena capillaripes]|nr:hypothetical protein B0H19DRAFT_1080614 [Mycena capillaripes]
MSTSNSAAQNPYGNTPIALQRRRTLVACTNCRKRKLRCITTEQPPKKPCARCTKKGLSCEYVSIEVNDSTSGHSRQNSASAFNNSSQDLSNAPPPPLPYTGPPAPYQRPRYSGSSQYPDLSLDGSSQPNSPPQYHPPPINQPMSDQGYDFNSGYDSNQGYNLPPLQGYQYPGNNAPTSAQPNAYNLPPIINIVGTWPPQQGSGSRYPGNDPRNG